MTPTTTAIPTRVALLLKMWDGRLFRNPRQYAFSQKVAPVDFVADIHIQELHVSSPESHAKYRTSDGRTDDGNYPAGLIANLDTQPRSHIKVALRIHGHAGCARAGGIVARFEMVKRLRVRERAVSLNLK